MMQEKSKKRSPKVKRAKEKNEKLTNALQRESSSIEDTDTKEHRATEQYVRGIITRGEAAKPVDGRLPPGATHEIVKENEKGLPTIQRRRYSAF